MQYQHMWIATASILSGLVSTLRDVCLRNAKTLFGSSPFSSHGCFVQIRAAYLPTTCSQIAHVSHHDTIQTRTQRHLQNDRQIDKLSAGKELPKVANIQPARVTHLSALNKNDYRSFMVIPSLGNTLVVIKRQNGQAWTAALSLHGEWWALARIRCCRGPGHCDLNLPMGQPR